MNELEEKKYIEEDDEIDLMELMKVLINNKLTLVVTTLLFTIIVVVGGYLYNKKNSSYSTILSLNYPGIEKGLNPDETQFNKNDLISTKELNTLFDKYSEKNLKSKDLKELGENISITGIVPDHINEKIEQALKKGEQISYTPTQYIISLKEDNEEMLAELIQDIIVEFNKKYKPQYEISEIILNNNYIYDYDDYNLIIKEQLKRLNSETTDEEKLKFISKSKGSSFLELNRKIENYKNINLKKYMSYIDIHGFTNNATIKKIKFESDIKTLNIEREKLLGEAKVIKKALDEFKPTEKQLVLPSVGEMGIKLDTENEYYSKLFEKYIAISTKATNKEYDIKYIEKEINDIKMPDEEEMATIKNYINDLIVELNKITAEINELNKEFFDVEYGETIKKIAPIEYKTTGKPVILYLIAGIALGLFAGIFVIFTKEFFKNYKKRYNR